MRISDWSSDVCSSDLMARAEFTLDQRTDEGGRLTPFYTNYRPNIAFGGGQPMKCEFFTEQEGGHKPGTVGEIGMTCPATTSVGQAFTAYERKRLIGRGVKIGRASCRERVCQYV